MNNERHEALIQDVVAGEATPQQQAEFERLLAEDPDASARHAELREMFRVLQQAPEPTPPADLHAGIMGVIASERRTLIASPRRGGLGRSLGFFLAGAAAAALVVVVGLRNPGGDHLAGDPASGTMAPLEAASEPMLSSVSLSVPGGPLSLGSMREGDRVRVVIRSSATRPVAIELSFADERLTFSGVRWALAPHGDLRATAGRVTLPGLGAGEVTLLFDAHGVSDSPIQVVAEGSARTLLHTSPRP